MNHYQHRHYFRLDDATQAALEEICRHKFIAKATLMRRYVQEGVAREAQEIAEETEKVLRACSVMRSI
jgi:hypothetical protein